MEMKGYTDMQAILNGNESAGIPPQPNLGNPGYTLPEQKQRELRRAYYCAVTHVDQQIGKVVAALDATGLAASTVVVMWADHGWQLGEHAEWTKHTNYELATHAPMIIVQPLPTLDLRAKSLQLQPRNSNEFDLDPESDPDTHTGDVLTVATPHFVDVYTEHVDLLPTLAALSMGAVVPACPAGSAQQKVALCTMGRSLETLMLNATTSTTLNNNTTTTTLADSTVVAADFSAAFSQYPRPPLLSNGTADLSRSWCDAHKEECTMGYSVVTTLDAVEYRFTMWVDYNSPSHPSAPDWSTAGLKGVELYVHTADGGLLENVNQASSSTYTGVVKKLTVLLERGPQTGGGWGPWQQQ
jgi:iduronate 2-sulfatase